MDDDPRISYERLLDPDQLRGTLIAAAIFVLSFETLRTAVVERLQTFFADGWSQGGRILGEEYEREVRSRDKNLFRASLAWHRERGVIDDSDLAKLDAARVSRNKLAHEMARWMTEEGLTQQLAVQLGDIINVLDEIENWWIVNLEMAIDADFDDVDVDPDDVIPGPVFGLRLMMEVALSAPDESRRYTEEFRRMAKSVQPNDGDDGCS